LAGPASRARRADARAAAVRQRLLPAVRWKRNCRAHRHGAPPLRRARRAEGRARTDLRGHRRRVVGDRPLMTVQSAAGGASARTHVLEILGNAIVGGMETYVVRLVRELARAEFRVTALCPFESHVSDALRDAQAEVLIAAVRDDPE